MHLTCILQIRISAIYANYINVLSLLNQVKFIYHDKVQQFLCTAAIRLKQLFKRLTSDLLVKEYSVSASMFAIAERLRQIPIKHGYLV